MFFLDRKKNFSPPHVLFFLNPKFSKTREKLWVPSVVPVYASLSTRACTSHALYVTLYPAWESTDCPPPMICTPIFYKNPASPSEWFPMKDEPHDPPFIALESFHSARTAASSPSPPNQLLQPRGGGGCATIWRTCGDAGDPRAAGGATTGPRCCSTFCCSTRPACTTTARGSKPCCIFVCSRTPSIPSPIPHPFL